MNLDNGWGILCGVYLNFLLLLTEQVRLCFWNDKDTSQESQCTDYYHLQSNNHMMDHSRERKKHGSLGE